MEQKPIVLTELALVRYLKEFALRFGLDDVFADALAQIHMQQSLLPGRWSKFLMSNCAGCRHDPKSCALFNPTPEQCPGETTPNDLRNANFVMIEMGRLDQCPLYEPETPAQPPGEPHE